MNSAFPDLIKIGRTIRESEQRAEELYTTGTPGKFVVVFEVFVDDCVEIEKIMHFSFSSKRFNENREFFKVPVKQAIDELHKLSTGRIIPKNSFVDSKTVNLNRFTACLYHISIIRNVHRIGIVKGDKDYINSDIFFNNLNDYYSQLNLKISKNHFRIWDSSTFENFNEYYIQKTNDLIIKSMSYEILNETFNNIEDSHKLICDKQTIMDKRLFGKYDNISESDDAVATSAFWDVEIGLLDIVEEIDANLHFEISKQFKGKI
jgi:hypothetical protein